MAEYLRSVVYETVFLAAFIVVACLVRPFERGIWGRVAEAVNRWFRGWRAVAFVFVLALALRGSLMPKLGIPAPRVHDEFSYLLMSDTLSHGRLTNPTPPSWEHFETFHENMLPTYHSKYLPGQGIALALGQMAAGHPWYGVYVSTALMCAAVCWALAGLLPTAWALLGGVLCVMRICGTGYWVNSYWGGSVTALGGALMLGATVRLLRAERPRALDGFLFGAGLMTLLYTRPLEGLLFAFPLGIAVLAKWAGGWKQREWVRAFAWCTAAIVPALAFFLYYNYRTTGSALQLPYFVYERNYNTAPLFILTELHQQPQFHHDVMAAFYQHWVWEASLYRNPKTLFEFENVRLHLLWDFYLGVAFTIPFIAGVYALRRDGAGRLALASVLLVLFAFAVVLAFHPHYFAPATAGVFMIVMAGMQALCAKNNRWARAVGGSIVVVALLFAMKERATWVYISRGPVTRQKVEAILSRQPGQHLVRVEYLKGHAFDDEIVFNGADFPSEKVLWARKMNAEKDAELCRAFPGRTFWDLATDDKSVSLNPSSLCEGSR